MERIDKVMMHPIYQDQGKRIEEAEQDKESSPSHHILYPLILLL